jgi:sugar transferase (PEP-CTERM system associated)
VAARDPTKLTFRSKDGLGPVPPILEELNTKTESLGTSIAATREPKSWRVSRSSVQLFGQHFDLWSLILAGVDLLLLCVAVHLAGMLLLASNFLVPLEGILIPWPEPVVFGVVVLSALIAMGLYSRRLDARIAAVVARMVVGLIIGGLATAVLLFFIDGLRLGPGLLAASVGLSLPLLVISRVLFVKGLGRERFARRVLVYGAGTKACELQNVQVRKDLRGFEVVGYVPTEGCLSQVPVALHVSPGESLREFVLRYEIDEVVVAMDDRRRGLPVQQLLECRLAGVPITDVLSFMERESGKVDLSMLYPSWLIYCDGINPRGLVRLLTRVLDLAAASLLLLVSTPVMLLTALAIWLESGFRGTVLYRQVRVGLEGAPYTLYKFRSMREDAEADGVRWATVNDPRVTRVGRFIRATRLDELPQLFNVLSGAMSFVGPRPERPEFVERLASRIPYYRERHCVKPGITGWAQLCYPYGASERDALEKLQYDLYYVKNKSLLFDLMILLQTAEVVLWRKGSR